MVVDLPAPFGPSRPKSSPRRMSTGGLGSEVEPKAGSWFWLPAPDGRFYQVHDPGNLVLLIPAAVVGRAGGPGAVGKRHPAPGPGRRVADVRPSRGARRRPRAV